MLYHSENTGKKRTGALQMESIVTVVRGESLDTTNKPCIFCGKTKNSKLLATTAGKKYDGTLLRTFVVCEEHFDKINALLSGEFDIDSISLEKYRKKIPQATLRFRG
jgi:hypothetical protein